MIRSRTQLVWVLAACAAVFAQAIPRALCRACDQPCCSSLADGHTRPAATVAEPAGGCPLCAAESDRQLPDNADRPCHCQLKARHDQPLSFSRTPVPAGADGARLIGPAFIPPVTPQVFGVSREYLAASLAIPIRPPRILFGVWRN